MQPDKQQQPGGSLKGTSQAGSVNSFALNRTKSILSYPGDSTTKHKCGHGCPKRILPAKSILVQCYQSRWYLQPEIRIGGSAPHEHPSPVATPKYRGGGLW
ncbi:hypothetical protein Pelo_7263 [Pelomyxa schiedti]|nr:hypothetical protein Pelo_7263 [Pelomyxa schiedti]